LPVAKSDNAELACQQTQTGCGQKPLTRRYSALRAAWPLEHYAELGIMFRCSPTPNIENRSFWTVRAQPTSAFPTKNLALGALSNPHFAQHTIDLGGLPQWLQNFSPL
jgi:hypothetical protein